MATEIQELTIDVRNKRRELDRKAGEARSVALRGIEVKREIVELKSEVALNEQCAVLLNSIGEDRQDEAQRVIEELVTRGLQAIFGDGLSFHLVTTTKANKTNVEFQVTSTLEGGNTITTSVMDARGGGVASVIGFLMRVVILLLAANGRDILLLCDETFSMVSDEYLDKVAEFVRELVENTGMQIVLVTHQPVFLEYADKAYRFSKDQYGHTIVS